MQQDLEALRPFKKQSEDARAESDKRKLEIDKLNKRISELEASNRNALEERNKKIQKLESDIKTLEALRGDVTDRDKKITALNTELEAAKKKASELTAAQEQLKKDVQAKEAQHQSKVNELAPWQQRFKDTEDKLKSKEGELAKLRTDSQAELERKLKAAEEQQKQLLDQRDKQIAELDAKIKQLETLKQDIAERDRKIAELERQKKAAEEQAASQINKLTSELDNEKKQVGVFQADIVGFRKSVDEKQGLLSTSDAKVNKLEARVRELEPLQQKLSAKAVSYTHLTLPTILLV